VPKAQPAVCITQDTLLTFTRLNFDLLYILEHVRAQVFLFSFVLLGYFPSVFYFNFSNCHMGDRRDFLNQKAGLAVCNYADSVKKTKGAYQ